MFLLNYLIIITPLDFQIKLNELHIKIAFSKEYILKLPEDHKFPINKYRLIPETLLKEGTISSSDIFAPGKADLSSIELTHTSEYVSKLINQELTGREIRKIGFPQTGELIERELIIVQGTITGSKYAIESGISFNTAGGTHHAYANSGEGFCVLNDVAVAANYLLHHEFVSRILIVDLDVHQGNGTARIFENTPEVFTFSMHGRDNYPLRKDKSDLDIPLPTGTTGESYLNILYDRLPMLISSFHPEIIFYISGVDVLESDRWGRLSLSREECLERDRFVFESAYRNSIPIMVAMGGGYSKNIDDIIEAHCNTFRAGIQQFL